jgi:hypothetical protein
MVCGSIALLAVLGWGPARADALSLNVTLDTAAFAGQQGMLAFDFIDGDGGDPGHPEGIGNNTVTITGFFPAAALLAAPPPVVTGGVSGTLSPGPLLLTDTQFFNELLQPVTLGGLFGFQVDMTEAFVNTPLTVPDAFSLALLTADASASLVATTDPTGADALVLMQADGTFEAFASSPDLRVAIGPVSGVPEPAPWLLLAVGGVALFRERVRRRRARGRAPR